MSMEQNELVKERPNVISSELNIPKENVDSYFRNYYINKTFPIRDLKPVEIALVKTYKEIMFHSEHDLRGMCIKHGVIYDDYLKDRWLLPAKYVGMTKEEYYIIKKYYAVVIEPFLKYENEIAPRLTPVSKEEIVMLLSNIAVGISIIPKEKINTFTSMMAMDKLVALYDTLPIETNVESDRKIKELSPKELEAIIDQVTKPKKPIQLVKGGGRQ